MSRLIQCAAAFACLSLMVQPATGADAPGKFDDAARPIIQDVGRQLSVNLHDALLAYEKGIREKLFKQFPDRPEPWAMLVEVAANWTYLDPALKPVPADLKRTRDLLNEIIQAPNAAQTTHEHARAHLAQLDRLGKPLAMQFEALPMEDGGARAVDLAKMRGQVVLISFWATWCGPCVADVDSLQALHKQHHKKDVTPQFEILGITADREGDRLRRFLRENGVAWPQHFDGKGWQNRFFEEHGITLIPTMWLVDRAGNLRDLNARHDLAAKVSKLLAEPAPAVVPTPVVPKPPVPPTTPTSPTPPEKSKEAPPAPKAPPSKGPEPKS